jgi:molecular chaperone Hsp33
MMKEFDTLQRFMFEHASIRGEIVHVKDVYQTIMQQRPYPPAVRTMLAEALMACILLTGSIKFEGEINLQFHGDERLPLIIVQCDNLLNVRACAKFKKSDDVDYTQAFMSGQMSLSIHQYKNTQTYQSIVPISTVSMAENLAHYFAQSEQIPSKVWLAIGKEHASGMILQLLPGQNSLQREQFWEYAVHIGQTITEKELLELDNQTILHRLYHETVLRLYDARSIRFKCRCNQAKMQQVLKVLGEAEIQQLLQETGHVEVYCDFCNHRYVFDPIDVAMLLR